MVRAYSTLVWLVFLLHCASVGLFLYFVFSGKQFYKDCTATDPSYKLKSLGGNVLGQKSCVSGLQGSDKVSRNARLGTLQDNGGPTKTMAISAKSPAVGRASYLIPGSDQRGHQRPGKHADAGAYERS